MCNGRGSTSPLYGGRLFPRGACRCLCTGKLNVALGLIGTLLLGYGQSIEEIMFHSFGETSAVHDAGVAVWKNKLLNSRIRPTTVTHTSSPHPTTASRRHSLSPCVRQLVGHPPALPRRQPPAERQHDRPWQALPDHRPHHVALRVRTCVAAPPVRRSGAGPETDLRTIGIRAAPPPSAPPSATSSMPSGRTSPSRCRGTKSATPTPPS